MKLFAVIRDGCSKLHPAPSPSPMVEMGQKGLSMVKVAQSELGLPEMFWQSKDAYDCGCEIRGLHHLFIVF